MTSKARIVLGMAVLFNTGIARLASADVVTDHPAGKQLADIFARPAAADFKPTGVDRTAYLKLMAANIDFFKKTQNAAGAIIDPVSKGERQYSTPAFAAAAGLLVKEAGRSDLLEPATKAMTCALTALVEKRPADKHADFYIPLLVHAFRFLKDAVPAEQSAKWAEQFNAIDPETMYRADLRGMNWNVVSSSGELLRRHDGLVSPDKRDAQMKYLESCLAGHLKTLTPVGLFEDPGAPLTYDAFSRLWLEDVFADDAYDGQYKDQIGKFLRTGGLSTLLMISPTGEWPVGGRSAMHNWADAEVAVICEINAAYWKKQGRDDLAGAFKRAAHTAFQSVARWQRPSGELNIIKNLAEPEKRLGYEGYSNHSQYNLLPMAMLAIAYSRADETVVERPMPSEVGGYVFDLRDVFHKVIAAGGGYYVEIDTAGDPHYNATGLQRVHKAGVLYPALTDSSAPDRAFGNNKGPKAGLALGAVWKSPQDGKWVGLSNFTGSEGKPKPNAQTASVFDVRTDAITPEKTQFTVAYTLAGFGAINVTESYVLAADGVTQTSAFIAPLDPLKVRLPVVVNDGAKDVNPAVGGDSVSVRLGQSLTTITAERVDPANGFKLVGPRIEDHSGYVQAAEATVTGGKSVVRIVLTQEKSTDAEQR